MSTGPTVADAAEAIEEVVYQFQMYTASNTGELDRAQSLVKLADAVADLKSWHPEYDLTSGTLPYEREASYESSDL